jgi:hypothetical protein
MLNQFEVSGPIAVSVVAMAISLAVFVAWNCAIDMRRPPGKWIDRAAQEIAQILGRRLPDQERVRLYDLLRRLIAGAAQDSAKHGTTQRGRVRQKDTRRV